MNSHQRRKARRRYEHLLQLKRVPYPLLELVLDAPGGMDQAQELCRSMGIPACLNVFKFDVDGTLEVVPPRAAELLWAMEGQPLAVALDYLVWRRKRYKEAAP